MPYMHLLLLANLMSFLQMLETGLIGLIWAVLTILLGFYVTICVFSLYERFKHERLKGFKVESLSSKSENIKEIQQNVSQ